MVGKGTRQTTKNYNYEPWRRFIKRGSFEPDPRLEKVDECTTDDPWTTDVHRIPVRRLLDRYGSSITKGLSESQVHKNRHFWGSNVIANSVSPSVKCWTLFKSLVFGLNSLMWVCLIFSVAVFFIRWISLREKPLENLIFAGVLLFVIVVITITFYYQTFYTQQILMAPEDRGQHCALAKRNGRFMEVPTSDLVVGDVVQLSYGDVIPADIRIIESHEFFVDNSGLTGESDPKRRRSVCTDNNPMETKNLAFFSTHALEGYAKGVVVNVGANTVMGRVAQVADKIQVKSESPVQKELDVLVKLLLTQACVFGILYFFASLYMTSRWKEALIHVMTVIVSNVPEGLTLTSTILLALICKKVRSFNCMVKNMHAVETLGATTCIVTDKTGTITQNRMAIAHLWFDDRIAEADTSEFLDGHQSFTTDDPGFLALARVARLCSRARFKPHQMDKPIFRREVQGDASEAAILRFMETHLGSVTKYRRKYKKIYEMPFNSRTKMQAFIYEIPAGASNSKQHYLTVKGAPEKLFELATSILIKDTSFTLDDKWRVKFQKVLEQLSSVGDRVIGFADALLPKDKFNDDYNYDTDKPEFLKRGLRFVGLMSMIDPPRAVVPEAVAKCKKFGMKLVMITGDHPITASAIAHATGILPPRQNITDSAISKKRISPSHLSLTIAQLSPQTAITMESSYSKPPASTGNKVFSGKDLVGVEPHQLDKILEQPGDMIFARTTPEQKFMIVESLQRLGHKVCVVGDGVNDSPAIKRADVGIVMGVTGSEVSKEIGDIVLLDDNFASVVQGIEEGRLGFENLGRLLRYTMADNVACMYCAGVSILFTLPRPFASMAMLLTLLGTDVIAAISLCYEQTEQGAPQQTPPQPKKKRKLITSQLISHIYSQVAVIEVAAGFFAYFATMATYGWTPARLISINKGEWDSPMVNDLMDDLYGQEWSWAARRRLESHCHAAFFVAIVIVQVANVLICTGHRTNILQRILSNWRVSAAICGELLIAAVILYVPRISTITGLSPLAPEEWTYALPFAVFMVVCDEVRRYLLRRKILVDSSLLQVILH